MGCIPHKSKAIPIFLFRRTYAFYVFGSNLTLVNSFEIQFLSHDLTDSASLKTRLFIIELNLEGSDLLSFCFVLQGSASSEEMF